MNGGLEEVRELTKQVSRARAFQQKIKLGQRHCGGHVPGRLRNSEEAR